MTDTNITYSNKKHKHMGLKIAFIGIMMGIIIAIGVIAYILSKDIAMYQEDIRKDLQGYADSGYIFMFESKEYNNIPDEVYDNPNEYSYTIVQNVVSVVKNNKIK